MKIEPLALGNVSFSVVDSEGDTLILTTWVVAPNHQEAVESFRNSFPDTPATYQPIVTPYEANQERV